MNPYQNLIADFARLLEEGHRFPLGGFPPCPRPEIKPDAPTVLLFAPHPDDECVIGALALRLLRQCHARVINVAVTQGSHRARQAERFEELRHACDYLGFELVPTRPNGLERVNRQTREHEPAVWRPMVQIIADLLTQYHPRVIFFPHEDDWNSTHIGTHWLVRDALTRLGDGFAGFTVETEYWGPMSDPNLAVESAPTDVGDLITGISFHVGEVKRNPYHLLVPPWMMDNVRRGGELVGGQGGAAPMFTYATLYRLRRWQNGRLERFYEGGQMLPAATNPATLFPGGGLE